MTWEEGVEGARVREGMEGGRWGKEGRSSGGQKTKAYLQRKE